MISLASRFLSTIGLTLLLLQAFPEFPKLLVGDIGQQLKVVQDEAVGDGHHLAVYLLGRLGDADVVAQALAHLVAAVGAHQQGDHKALLGALAHHRLQLPAHQEVELLVGAAEFDIGLDGYRIISLEQGVEQLGEGDGLFRLNSGR